MVVMIKNYPINLINMRRVKLFEDFIAEKGKKPQSVKQKVKGLNKKIKKAFKKKEDLVNKTKEIDAAQKDGKAEPSDKLQKLLIKSQIKSTDIDAKKTQAKQQELVLKAKVKTAKEAEKAKKEVAKESLIIEAEETYNDYPAAAKKNAQKAIDWKEKYGRDEVDAGTPVGWARAHQLAKGENLSADTVGRMSAFNRHRKNSKISAEYKETPWKDKGYVAWLIWGGDEGVDWATEKMKEIKR